ncbi:MAG: sulfite exporter TauE/SafE family protein [Gammaproteobacteria bacterium]|nr:sulfite exporter TauE/SafE family protein [Gammaproteobacteria bacterium]
MLEDASTWAVLGLFGVTLFAGVVHGALGLGFPVILTPVLALFLDVRLAILWTLLPTASVNLASVLRGHDWGRTVRRYWPLALSGLLASLVGSAILIRVDPAPFKLVLAALLLVYLWVSWRGALDMPWTRSRPLLSMLVFGGLAGLAGGTTNIMVSILIIYALETRLARDVSVQVFNMSFLCGKLAQMLMFARAGQLDAALLVRTVPVALVALLGLHAGMRIRERIPVELYRRFVRGLLLLFALLLIGQFVYELGSG